MASAACLLVLLGAVLLAGSAAALLLLLLLLLLAAMEFSKPSLRLIVGVSIGMASISEFLICNGSLSSAFCCPSHPVKAVLRPSRRAGVGGGIGNVPPKRGPLQQQQ